MARNSWRGRCSLHQWGGPVGFAMPGSTSKEGVGAVEHYRTGGLANLRAHDRHLLASHNHGFAGSRRHFEGEAEEPGLGRGVGGAEWHENPVVAVFGEAKFSSSAI